MNNPHYYVQNILEGFDNSDVEEVQHASSPPPPISAYSPPTPPTPPIINNVKKGSKKRGLEFEGSYVMSKKTRKGLRLIKIEVYDLMDETTEDPYLKAQHIVVEHIDDILDLTENVIKKNSKTISDQY